MKRTHLILSMLLCLIECYSQTIYQAGPFKIKIDGDLYYNVKETQESWFLPDKIILTLKDKSDFINIGMTHSINLVQSFKTGAVIYSVPNNLNFISK